MYNKGYSAMSRAQVEAKRHTKLKNKNFIPVVNLKDLSRARLANKHS